MDETTAPSTVAASGNAIGPELGCPNKTFFKFSQVSPYGKFPYDQNIPHKKFQII